MGARRIEVTNSELSTMRQCAKRWWFAYHERLRPRVTALPLRFGDIFHTGMEAGLLAAYAMPEAAVPLRTRMAISAARQAAERRHEVYKDELVAAWHDAAMEEVDLERLSEEAHATTELVQWMLGHYFTATQSDFERLVPLGIELPFDVPIMYSSGLLASPVRWRGKIDAVYYDKATGTVVVDDHKTTGTAVWDTVDRRLELDPQMAGYQYAVRYMLGRGELRPMTADVVPDSPKLGAVRYNVLRKKLPSEPKVNKDGTVSTAACDTTARRYREALDAQITLADYQAGKRNPHLAAEAYGKIRAKQEAILQQLQDRGDAFFSRREWYRTEDSIAEWQRETLQDVHRLRVLQRDPDQCTRNAGACTMPWSMACPYRAVCMNDEPETRELYRVAGSKHEELEATDGEENSGE